MSPELRDELAPGEDPPPEPGHALLQDIVAYLTRHVVFPSQGAADAVALWAVHTHLIDAFDSTPRLAVLSPDKGCGKTRCLEVIEHIVRERLRLVNASVAAVFRSIELKQPTLLFDEADTYFGPRADRSYEELRGLVNAGHRRGETVLRMIGEGAKMEPKEFLTFAPVAMSGIGDLPETILQRSVVIRMRRRAPDEHVQEFRFRDDVPPARCLGQRTEAWAERNLDAVAASRPDMPSGVMDRAADVWEPLLAVADVAGGDWPERARAACLELVAGSVDQSASLGVRLLSDIRDVVGESGRRDRMSSTELCGRLAEIEEAPWGSLFQGRTIDARWLAKHPRPYDIRPGQLRFDGDSAGKGYLFADFEDAFSRYLPPVPQLGETSETRETLIESETDSPPPASDVSLVSDVSLLGAKGQDVSFRVAHERRTEGMYEDLGNGVIIETRPSMNGSDRL
jgi:hypothetical protein